MSRHFQAPVASNPVTDFTQALSQNGISDTVSLKLPWKQGRCIIDGFVVESLQNLEWELWLFSSATNLTENPLTDGLVGIWNFPDIQTNGPGYTVTPVGGSSNALYRYFSSGNEIPYMDLDWMQSSGQGDFPSLHLRLINRSSGGKSADGPGLIGVTTYVSQMGIQA